MSLIAAPNVARTSPTLPPIAMMALAMRGRMPCARQDHADIFEYLRDRRVRLVYGDLDSAHFRKCGQDRVDHGARRALQQLVIGVLEGAGRGFHHAGIGHGIGKPVGVRGFRKVGVKLEVDDKALPDLGLMPHHAVTGMHHDALDENDVGHRFSSIATMMRNACTISATSWARMMSAPRCAARRCAAIDPPIRSSGSAGPTEAMKRLREAPTRIGRPRLLSSSSRANAILLWSDVLPKPMPGSSTIFPRGMPAWPAISSERAKKANMSCMMSIAGSALSRLCMTMTGTLRAATSVAIPASRCRPQTSLTIAAPVSSANAATSDFMLSIETGTPSATASRSTGVSRAISVSA